MYKNTMFLGWISYSLVIKAERITVLFLLDFIFKSLLYRLHVLNRKKIILWKDTTIWPLLKKIPFFLTQFMNTIQSGFSSGFGAETDLVDDLQQEMDGRVHTVIPLGLLRNVWHHDVFLGQLELLEQVDHISFFFTPVSWGKYPFFTLVSCLHCPPFSWEQEAGGPLVINKLYVIKYM